MEKRSGQVHVTTNEARGGSTPHVVRWVLGISLLAAVILLSIVWMTGAATNDPSIGETSAEGRISAESAGDTTDSIVSDGADDMANPTTVAPGEPPRVAN